MNKYDDWAEELEGLEAILLKFRPDLLTEIKEFKKSYFITGCLSRVSFMFDYEAYLKAKLRESEPYG